MLRQCELHWLFLQSSLVELGIENRLDTAVRDGAGVQRSGTSRLQACSAMDFFEADQSQACPVTLLRMHKTLKYRRHKLCRLRAGLLRPTHEPLRFPRNIGLMRLGHVIRDG